MQHNCKGSSSCKGMNSCNGKMKMPDNSVGMDKRKDLIATPKFKKVMQEYGNGTLKSSSGADVNGPKQAEAIAASESGQSYNQAPKNKKDHDRYGIRSRSK